VREKVYAVFAFLRPSTAPNFASDEVSLAREVAAKAAIALENAMLVRSIQEADQRKDEFLGMLAHELRNPLAPIRNAIELLQVAEPQDTPLEQARSVIDRQVAHMSRLVDDLLDATRIARGKVLLRRERCDLSSIVCQTTEDHRSIFDGAQLQLSVDKPPGPIWVQGDPTRLAQAVGNLLHNAQKFTDEGGSVQVRLSVIDGGTTAAIIVRDTGIGIDPRTLPHVFDMFRQAEQGLDRTRGGLGLGLTLVKGLAELHGGSVSAASAGQGHGAEFTVLSTRRPRPRTPWSRPGPPRPTAPSAHYRILVVDDNTDAAETICALLGRDGHEVRSAPSGTSGLEVAREFHPDVVVCDIGLPGMDGYAVARAIRAEAPIANAFLIALTGYGRDEDVNRSRAAGFDLHLTKPIGIVQLRTALASVTGRNGA
jgi:signal transduction histidine kinase/ActR/RegA family two-component response regulator